MSEVAAKQKRTDFDVVVVGGGMVGAALACALGEKEIRVAVVEAQVMAGREDDRDRSDFEPRVSALTQASRNFLNNIGAWEFVSAHRHCPFERMQVWDAEGTGSIAFNAAEIGQLALGYIIENAAINEGLYRRMAQLDNVELIAPARLKAWARTDQGKNRIVLEGGRELTAALLVGADGAQSGVRELTGIAIAQRDYQQSAIVTTVKTERSHQMTAWQRFLPTGPLAFLPLLRHDGDDHYCSIVWSLDTDQVDPILGLNDATFAQALGRAFEYKLGNIETVARRFRFPLIQRHAKCYTKEGVVLVGDAAHTIHPLAGQGVNLGFLDVAVLAEEILRALERGLPLTDSTLLSRYQRRRVADNLIMMNLMTGFKRLFEQKALPVRWARNVGMTLVNRFAPMKNHIAARAMGVSGDLPVLARPGNSLVSDRKND